MRRASAGRRPAPCAAGGGGAAKEGGAAHRTDSLSGRRRHMSLSRTWRTLFLALSVATLCSFLAPAIQARVFKRVTCPPFPCENFGYYPTHWRVNPPQPLLSSSNTASQSTGDKGPPARMSESDDLELPAPSRVRPDETTPKDKRTLPPTKATPPPGKTPPPTRPMNPKPAAKTPGQLGRQE